MKAEPLTTLPRHSDLIAGQGFGARAVVWLVVPLAVLLGLVQLPSVPDLVGLTVPDAQEQLREFDDSWTLSEQNEAPSGLDVEPVVVAQGEPRDDLDPDRGSFVPVTVGVAMPEVAGLPEQSAREDLRAVGLRTIEIAGADDIGIDVDGELSSVIVRDQSPAAGELVSFDDTVSLTLISTIPEQVEVPTLVGRDLATARELVAGAGLGLSAPGGPPEDIVQTQDPAPGELVAADTVVVVTVAAAGVVVPDLVQSHVEVARELLARRGLQLSGPDAGVISAQDPRPGVTVGRGSVVVVEVGVPPAGFEVPNLVGLTPSEARDVLGGDLVLGPVPSDEAIIGQDPAVGELVPQGSTINVTVSEASPIDDVVVPTVVGLSVEDARLALDRTGLATEASDTDGSVVEQDPLAGRVVARGTLVSLVLSTVVIDDSEVADDSGWVLWVVGVASAAAAALAAGARMGHRRGRSWASRVVTAQALPSRPRVFAAAPDAPAVVIRLVPRAGSWTTYSTRKHR